MAVQQAVAQKWQQLTGRPLLEAYGLTETSPAVTINPLDLPAFNHSIGLPLPSTEVSLRDDAGAEVPPGDAGELCVRGPQVMREYWNRPDETAKVFFPDGFLRTGDVARMDERGFLYIVDRKKDMILVSGFNVYPNEVEDVIALHPGVLEVAVVGVPDERSGEAVKAYVVRRDPTLDAEAIRQWCRERLTPYKVRITSNSARNCPRRRWARSCAARCARKLGGRGEKPLVRDRISCFTFVRESSRSALVIRFPVSLAVLLLVRVGVGLRAPRRD